MARLAQRRGRTIDYAAWRQIDAAEVAAGRAVGKPREKLVTVADMLAVAAEAA